MERTRVYIAGPYSQGDRALNVRLALDAAGRLLDNEYAPYVPHLTHFWHLVHPKPYEVWLKLDREWLLLCHALLRLPGASDGADREMEWAANAGIPIYHDLDRLITSLGCRQEVWHPQAREVASLRREVAEAQIARDATLLNLSPEEYKARLEQYRAALAAS